eukprot:TRINITY_DN888_c0_g1_i6.p2 TRINITY_DN888_c0_g1~~TRINITY_DN888_c0_g1_i6.p2  ORF type:complete len:105 (-),score=12.08 TRINITY_DN888_c0_g1_i6:168-482(-)
MTCWVETCVTVPSFLIIHSVSNNDPNKTVDFFPGCPPQSGQCYLCIVYNLSNHPTVTLLSPVPQSVDCGTDLLCAENDLEQGSIQCRPGSMQHDLICVQTWGDC